MRDVIPRFVRPATPVTLFFFFLSWIVCDIPWGVSYKVLLFFLNSGVMESYIKAKPWVPAFAGITDRG
jgi:hypothetical protein